MTVAIIVFSAVNFGLCSLPGAQQISLHISVDSNYPLHIAANQLEQRHGIAISYEDARYLHASDLIERKHYRQPGSALDRLGGEPEDLIYRRGQLDMHYTVSPDTGAPEDLMEVLQALCDNHEANGNPGVFGVRQSDGMFHIVPLLERSEEEYFREAKPLLDTVISFPAQERTAYATVEAIANELQKQFPKERIGLGRVPINRFLQTRLTVGASNEPARQVLIRVLDKIEGNYSWSICLCSNP